MYFDWHGLFFIAVMWREKYVLIYLKIWEPILVYCSENAHQLLSILEYHFRYETLLKNVDVKLFLRKIVLPRLWFQSCKRKMAVSNLGWKIFLLIKIPDTKGRNKIYLFTHIIGFFFLIHCLQLFQNIVWHKVTNLGYVVQTHSEVC